MSLVTTKKLDKSASESKTAIVKQSGKSEEFDLKKKQGQGRPPITNLQDVKKKVGSAKNDEKKRELTLQSITKILDTIPTGKEAIEIMNKYKIKVKFEKGGGSYYSSDSNTVTIDSDKTEEEAALTFIHEMNHAKYKNMKLTADVQKLSRADYVKKMVEEEAEGVIKSIEGKIELEGTNIDVSKVSYPLEKEYRKSYKSAVETAKAKDPKAKDDDLKKIGREAGRLRVIKGFNSGEVLTSNTGEKYPDYYGKYWDEVHKK